jgi:geranylgeranyl pyrophosphate synthase
MPHDHIDAVATFGHSYGMAFQLVDDVLDLVSDESALGKPAGHDIEEGVYTLPVIFALDDAHGGELRGLLVRGIDPDARLRAIDLVRDGSGITRTIARARAYAEVGREALSVLPESSGVAGLFAAADYLLDSVEAAAA